MIELVAQVRGHSARTLTEFPLWSRCPMRSWSMLSTSRRPCCPSIWPSSIRTRAANFTLLAAAAALVVLALVTWFAIAQARRWPFVLVGWLWYLGHARADDRRRPGRNPADGRPLHVFSDVGTLRRRRLARPRARRQTSHAHVARSVPILAGGVVCLYAAIAFVQVGYWRDGVTLMRRSLARHARQRIRPRVAGRRSLCAVAHRTRLSASFEHAVRLCARRSRELLPLGLGLAGSQAL